MEEGNMKHTGRTFLCLLISLALVLGSLAWGARKGWQAESQDIQKLYAQEGGLSSMLDLRAADASNLIAVAKRHVDKQDESLKAVTDARDVLRSGSASLSQKYDANQSLTGAADALSKELQGKTSLQEDTKDWNYVISLTKALEVYADGDAVNAYNSASREYNKNLAQSFSGWFAMLTGVHKVELFD
jgi:hypothetical protein